MRVTRNRPCVLDHGPWVTIRTGRDARRDPSGSAAGQALRQAVLQQGRRKLLDAGRTQPQRRGGLEQRMATSLALVGLQPCRLTMKSIQTGAKGDVQPFDTGKSL
jgi:hypothetical protein